MANWKRVFRRVRGMSGAELTDRIRQLTTARLDLLRYRIGADFAPQMIAGSGVQPHFFFSSQAVPSLCAKLRQLFPDAAERIVERGERICQHRFNLLGFEGLDYGSEIDWHCDRVHDKRAPRKPWYQVKYLDFGEVGDSKVTWELNRHQHLVTLAKAFRLSGNEKFATELFRQWHHWHGENPYPIGINWASSLEVAFRSLSWLWIYFLLADSPLMPAGFRTAWLRAIAVSGRHIDRYLSTYFSPNTHLLGEAVALFFIGTLCPEIPGARRWQQRGWKIVQQEAVRQVRSDGLHFEQSTYYHVYALDFFLHASVLASLNQTPAAKEFDRTVERMLGALAVLGRCGAVPRLGDDDGGRLFDPSRNRAEHLLDPLATGAVLFGRGDFKALAGGLREETLWLLGEAGVKEFDGIPAAQPQQNSKAFPKSGLYVMTAGDKKSQIVIDAGELGAHTAGHGHADALSITACCDGRDLLLDSGTFEYVGRSFERDRFRSTRAHSTLMIAGQDQAEPRGPFGWQRLPKIQAEGWIAGKTFDLFVGSHDGYARLPNPVVHRRFVFGRKSGFWLVRDLALGAGEQQLDLYWHLGNDFRAPDEDTDYFSATSVGLRLLTVDGHEWARSLEPHSDSPAYGQKQDHSVLHFAIRTQLPTEFVTVLQSSADVENSEHRLTKLDPHASPVSPVVGYRYGTRKDEHCIFFGSGKEWKLDAWKSDAEFLYRTRVSDAGQNILIACNATFVEWEDRRIITMKRPVLRCEIIGGEQPEIVSTEPEAVMLDHEAWTIYSSPVAVKAT